MSAHMLTIRPVEGAPEWPAPSDLEVLLDGERLDGVTKIEIQPLEADSGQLVSVTLHICVRPDFQIPAKVVVERAA